MTHTAATAAIEARVNEAKAKRTTQAKALWDLYYEKREVTRADAERIFATKWSEIKNISAKYEIPIPLPVDTMDYKRKQDALKLRKLAAQQGGLTITDVKRCLNITGSNADAWRRIQAMQKQGLRVPAVKKEQKKTKPMMQGVSGQGKPNGRRQYYDGELRWLGMPVLDPTKDMITPDGRRWMVLR